MLDFHQYLADLLSKNRLATDNNFHVGTCTGIEGIEDVINNFRRSSAFVLIDDITTGETFRTGGAWYERRTLTIFILMRHAHLDERQRIERQGICRNLRRQIQSRIIADAHLHQDTLAVIDLERMPTTDIDHFAASGCTGCYFMINIDEPVNLCLNPDEWN